MTVLNEGQYWRNLLLTIDDEWCYEDDDRYEVWKWPTWEWNYEREASNDVMTEGEPKTD